MHPVEFYHQAVRWYGDTADQRPETARSIVSRAYYAAILSARDAKKITAEENVHRITINAYKCGPPQELAIGNRLEGLRRMRVVADYKLSQTCARSQAGEAIKRSLDLLQRLGITMTPAA